MFYPSKNVTITALPLQHVTALPIKNIKGCGNISNAPCFVVCWYAMCRECIPGQPGELFIGVSSPESEPRVFVFVGTSRNVNTEPMSRRGKLIQSPDPRSDPGSKDPA